ncbi:MAG: hypothetical protein ABR543_15205 [Gemmatimonadaceae bacterium]
MNSLESRRSAFVIAVLISTVACAPGWDTERRSQTRPAGSELSDLVTEQYDPATDTTRVRTTPMPVLGTLEIYAGFKYAGHDVPAEPSVALVFQETSAAPIWENPIGRELVLVLDDTARVHVDRTFYRQDVIERGGPITLKVIEWVWVDLPPETFARISGAKKISGTIARTEFSLGQQHLTAFRELARRLPRADSAGTTSEP